MSAHKVSCEAPKQESEKIERADPQRAHGECFSEAKDHHNTASTPSA
jgi:hypothetical protein